MSGFGATARRALAMMVLIVAFAWLGIGPAEAQGCTEEVPGVSQCGEIVPTTLAQPDTRSVATATLDYAFGVAGNQGCFFCDFTENFLVSLSAFSAGVFALFRDFFVIVMPLVFAIWFAWKAFVFFFNGSEDGAGVMRAYASKGGLFFLIWLILLPDGLPQAGEGMSPVEGDAPWTWIGPEALRMGFMVAGEVRGASLDRLTVGGQSAATTSGFNCRGVGRGNATIEANPGSMAFAYYATETVCTVERTYIVVVAVALSMITSAFENIEWASWYVVLNIAKGMMIAIFGFVLLAMSVLAVVWLAFAILDAVLTFLIIAAVSPVLFGFGFLSLTRKYLFAAGRMLAGSFVKLSGYAIGLALTFYLMAHTVEVYNTSIEHYNPMLLSIPSQGSTYADLAEFVRRVGMDSSKDEWIPMTIGSPWYIYLLIVMASALVLTKAIVRLLDSIVGATGGSDLADSGKRATVVGGGLAVAGAFVGAKMGWWGTKKTAQGAGFVGKGMWKGYKASGAPVPALNPAKLNPFGAVLNRFRGGSAAALRGAGQAGMAAGAQARSALDAADDTNQPR